MGDDEQAIVDGLRRGEEIAYRRLLAAHGPRLLAVARRMVGESEAPDALQDAMLNAFRQIDSFRGDARLATWLHRITVNACLARMRRTWGRAEESLDDLLPEFDATGHRIEVGARWPELPEDAASRAELCDAVRECVARLPENYRAVFVLSDVEGFGGTEVAEMMGITHNAVKIRLHRARQALRSMMEASLGEGTAWV